MAAQPFKNVIIAGAGGTIGAPIVAGLLEHGGFRISALSRLESHAQFPPGIDVKKVDLNSYEQLVEAFEGQDVVICTLNDATAVLQPVLIEAAFAAGVRRFMQNEWGSHELTIPGTPLDDMKAGKEAVVELLNQKVQEAEKTGREFHWTGVNNGTFFDWAIHAGFIDINILPNQTATIWDSGNNISTFTNLKTVATAVIAVLTTAENQTRDRLLNIESFAASQNEIVDALQKATGKLWTKEATTTQEQLTLAQRSFEAGDFLPAFYLWVRACIFSSAGRLLKIDNELLRLPKEDLQSTVETIFRDKQSV